MKRLIVAAIIAIAFFLPHANAQTDFSQVVVFGDSLSDTGNSFDVTGIPPSGPGGFPYFEGRFSNGPIWIDFLQLELGLAEPQVLNFAVGGSSTGFGAKAPPKGIFETPPGTLIPTVGTQIETYLQVSQPDPNQLTILWAGSNDLFTFNTPRSVVNNLDAHVRRLAAAGADEFLIPGISPLGTTPSVNRTFEGFLLDLVSWRTNQLLDRRLKALEQELSIEIHRIDTFNLTFLGIFFPDFFGLTNTSDAALLEIQAGNISPSQGATYLYWDIIHPTSQVHSVIAAVAAETLAD